MKHFKILLFLIGITVIFACSKDNPSVSSTPTPTLLVTGNNINFPDTNVLSFSTSQSLTVQAENLTNNLMIQGSTNFQISLDNASFSQSVSINSGTVNATNQILYIRFAPTASAIGITTGTITFTSQNATTVTINVSGTGLAIEPIIVASETDLTFGEISLNSQSDTQTVTINGSHLTDVIDISTTGEYEISLDGITFSNSLQITAANANNENQISVRFIPTSVIGALAGILTIANSDITSDIAINLNGEAIGMAHNYTTFQDERLAFGGGYSQSAEASFNLHPDVSTIRTIKMFVKLRCPTGGCNAWDVFANIKVKDTDSGNWYEMGRYITPYGVDNSQVDRGFEIDVSDFRSLLEGNVELRAYIETWGSDGWELSIDFDYVEGVPDYPYYAIAGIFTYDVNSLEGVPYGEAHTFDLDKMVTIPANAEATSLRTIITGWGHATPTDADGRPCAEWCYRTHNIKINGANTFDHNMGPIGCATNPVNPQSGNYLPDRAGWCPGMAVPVRTNDFATSMAGSTFTLEYEYENWTTDGGNTSGTSGAYYATSTFVIVKSNTPIVKPTIN